ncbi:MAG TPA: PQQ-binding-like beta-propeller repeat protein [Gemmataceae bacterium]|nr:PQQ-binding-like beta-propeller repeat protein [Gemmataceae bacterium]
MSSRLAVAAGLLLFAAAPVLGQTAGVYSRAVPPAQAPLERLNLKTEWTLFLPVEGKRDTILQIQTFDDQLFIQTRTGYLVVVDARTGQIQWAASLGNGAYANIYPVAVNSRYVYVANVTKLYSFHRYTGVTEFVVDLGTMPTTGMAADESGVYTVLAMRPGSAGAHRVAVYDLPHPIAVQEAAANAALDPKHRDPNVVNPVDDVSRRYPSAGGYRSGNVTEFEATRRPSVSEIPVGGMTGTRSPSLAALPRVTPPYALEGMPVSPSLNPLPSLRQPYRLRNDFQKDIQQSPSISTIPPSVAAALALTDLRPRGVEPPLRWEYGLTSPVLYPPLLTPFRVWVATDDRSVIALSKVDKTIEVIQKVPDGVSAPVAQGGVNAYVPIGDGTLVALEGTTGNRVGGANMLWRAQVGGIMNRTPLITEDAVFAAGDNSGVARIDRKTGEVIWKSDTAIDRVVAVNQEFAYLRDRQGRLHIFDVRRPTDPGNRRSVPLTGMDLSEFNIPITNTVSDRIYLAADNGLIVCLRDASPKYARAVRMTPEPTVNPPPKTKVDVPQLPKN